MKAIKHTITALALGITITFTGCFENRVISMVDVVQNEADGALGDYSDCVLVTDTGTEGVIFMAIDQDCAIDTANKRLREANDND